MELNSKNISPFLVVYYLVLLVGVFLLMQPGAILPMALRIVLLGLLFIPTFTFNNSRILPAVALLFLGVDTLSFTHVFPAENLYLLFGVSTVYFLKFRRSSGLFVCWMFVFVYYLFCAMFHADVEKNFLWLFIAIMLGDMIREKRDLQLLFYSFLLISIFLGLLFLAHQEEFVYLYGHKGEEMERSSWMNSNVFGGAIAAGGVLSLSYLTGFLKLYKSKETFFISIIAVIITFLVLVLNASRGAFLAFALSAVIMVLMNKSKWYVKPLILIVIGIITYVFYTNDYFMLLSARMEAEDFATAGARTDIWETKFSLFISLSTPMELIFGIGQMRCLSLGVNISTHNDFITALIAYGFVGAVIFLLFFFIYPVLKAGKQNRWAVIILLIYLLLECSVLEPIFRGYIIEIMYFFFVLKYALINNMFPISKTIQKF